MTQIFQTIGLISKPGDATITATLTALINHLIKRGRKVVLDESAAAYFKTPSVPVLGRQALAKCCDLAIVVGGDGSMLSAGRSLVDSDVAILGINLGRLGFLADISPDEMDERLGEIFAGSYEEEQRTLLHARIIRAGQCINENSALNDMVIHKWDIARMIELDTSIDGRLLNSLRADGLIISTPTGSTAYALSGGGPIIDPGLCALVLVPVCPHTLSNRPIVVSDQSSIEILVHGDDSNQAQITCDGQTNYELASGDIIRIEKKAKTLRLIHPQQHDHFSTLRKKLHWAEQP
ncbi:NAD kinase [hydrothermal vent metagenome]|uniref:NAD kinase n=1 Tax=hydrothermal vent metagenome TaxID=652676 RepID=A0A3B0Z3M5_9ZZZZ